VLKYYTIAQEESLLSDHPAFKLGACLVKKHRVLSSGHNLITKTHPLIRKYDEFKTIHAEVHAIVKMKDKNAIDKATMYIYRAKRNGSLALAKPCDCCRKIMKVFGIKHIHYTTEDGWQSERL